MTNKYEAMMVFSVKTSDEAAQALVAKFKDLIAANGTLEGEVTEWAKRKLAYPINYETEGWYAIYTFTSEPEFPAELDRIAKITDGVLRSMVIKKNA